MIIVVDGWVGRWIEGWKGYGSEDVSAGFRVVKAGQYRVDGCLPEGRQRTDGREAEDDVRGPFGPAGTGTNETWRAVDGVDGRVDNGTDERLDGCMNGGDEGAESVME